LLIEINSGSVLYSKNSLDLTEEVIEVYNKKFTEN
jgi:Skp family chaperone for outer membrane proteins